MNTFRACAYLSYSQQQDMIVGKIRKILFLVLVLLIPNLASVNSAEAKTPFFEFCAKSFASGSGYKPTDFKSTLSNHTCPKGYVKGSYNSQEEWIAALNQYAKLSYKNAMDLGYYLAQVSAPLPACGTGGPC
jgi:hypothetical protein